MPNAFGFAPANQQPTPDPRAVGQQLAQPRQQQPQQPQVDPESFDFEAPANSKDLALRREGAKLMGGGGDDNDGALSAAVGEALTRAGGGHRGNPNPFKDRDRHVAHLQRLGISQLEAQLLRETI